MARIKLGIVGVGKIARDQHLPVIAASEDFELVAAASRNASVDGVHTYSTLEAMLAGEPSLEAIALCAPPGSREHDARLALSRGLHLLLEKPPATTPKAAREIAALAGDAGLCFSWHSRHAPGVEPAREWLRFRRVSEVAITWKEDIRRWHPGQDWILDGAGMGVFDPGVNALSIITHILPTSLMLSDAELDIPSNREAPIAARLRARTSDGAPVTMDLDFLHDGDPRWEIAVETDRGLLRLLDGGALLFIDGQTIDAPSSGRHHEYVGVYARFASIVRTPRVDADVRPLELAADALHRGARRKASAFNF